VSHALAQWQADAQWLPDRPAPLARLAPMLLNQVRAGAPVPQ
jgi:hypothetical protein